MCIRDSCNVGVKAGGDRITILHRNVPNMIGQFTTLPAPITHPSPMVTPPQTTTLDASQQLSLSLIHIS